MLLTGTELWAVSEEAVPAWAAVLERHARALRRGVRRGVPARAASSRQMPSEMWDVTGETAARLLGLVGGAGERASGPGVAVIPVYGLIVQHPSWNSWLCATEDVQRAVAAALALGEVSAVVLRFHSPGGTAYGVQALAEYLMSVRGGPKPIIGHADSVACSAAYWLLAACTQAWATPGGDVASVGAYLEHVSTAKRDQDGGVVRTLFRAPDGKNLSWDGAPLSETAREHLTERVNTLAAVFQRGVARARGVSLDVVRGEEWGRGRMLSAERAAKLGMLDGVRPFVDSVVAAARLARASAGGGATRAEEAEAATATTAEDAAAGVTETAETAPGAGEVDRLFGEELLRLEAAGVRPAQ